MSLLISGCSPLTLFNFSDELVGKTMTKPIEAELDESDRALFFNCKVVRFWELFLEEKFKPYFGFFLFFFYFLFSHHWVRGFHLPPGPRRDRYISQKSYLPPQM